jgi:cytidylate kinase
MVLAAQPAWTVAPARARVVRYNPDASALMRAPGEESLQRFMIIAIDGPAGSGKSSVAKAVATRLGFHYLDTGAMYRAVAWAALHDGVSLEDEAAVAAIALERPIEFSHQPGEALPSRISIGGVDVTREIRLPEVDDAVSIVASMPAVRSALVPQQRHIANATSIVVEGRDIGTVVFPDAELKVYLTATPEERARRRAAQHAERGHAAAAEDVLDALERRDALDSTRAHSPLSAARDATEVDTTGMTFDEVVADLVRRAKERGA